MSQTYADVSHTDTGRHEQASRDLSRHIPTKDALLVALAAGLGYGFDAYAVNLYGLLLPSISAALGFGSGIAGVVGSIFLIGYTLGTMAFGIAADRYGRKDTLGVSILIYGATTALGGFGSSVIWFTSMRFLTGIGGAGELAIGAPYTCEMFPTKYRAIGTGGITFSLYSLGYILAGLVALFAVPILGWRWSFYLAVIPAILVFLLRRFVQESVQYVVNQATDKFEAAEAIRVAYSERATAEGRTAALASIQNARDAETTTSRIGTLLAQRRNTARHGHRHVVGVFALAGLAAVALLTGLLWPNLAKIWAATLVTGGCLVLLLSLALYALLDRRAASASFVQLPVVRKRIGIGWLLYSANAAGYWGVTTFLTTFMVQKFGISASQAVVYAVLFYALQFVFCYLGTGLADWIGRRPAGILGAVLMIASTIFAATAGSFGVFLVFGGIQIALLGWLWSVGDCYLSELFPTSIRGAGFGLGVGGGRIVSIAAPFLVGIGIASLGVTVPFLLSAGLWILTIIGYAIGPETAHKSIEMLEEEFVAEAETPAG